jgi:hypothetical protein
MSQPSRLKMEKSKAIALAATLAFVGVAHAQERPALAYVTPPPASTVTTQPASASLQTAPKVATAPAGAYTPPAVSSAPVAAAPGGLTQGAPSQTQATTVSPSHPETQVASTRPAHTERVRHVAKRAKHVASASAKAASGDVTYSPSISGEITVSDRDLNDFVFASPITNGPILPAGVPLVGKPIYMANNSQVLLQFQKGYDKPIQAIVETEDGKVHKLYLLPRPISGVTYHVDNAREQVATPDSLAHKSDDATAGDQPGAHAEDIELLKRVVKGDVPPEFEAIALPQPTRFDKFTVVPLSGWSDGASKRVMVFSLVAAPGQTAVVAPPQFYRAGISAVMLTGDHVSEDSTPQLFVVEELNNE